MALFFDHDSDDHVVHGFNPVFRSGVGNIADVSPHTGPVVAAGLRGFRSDQTNAVPDILGGAAVGEQHVLNTGVDGPSGNEARVCSSTFIMEDISGKSSTARPKLSSSSRLKGEYSPHTQCNQRPLTGR